MKVTLTTGPNKASACTATDLNALRGKSTFGFPQNMQLTFPSIHNGATRENGVYAPTTGFWGAERRSTVLTQRHPTDDER
jgi:hypothetical protein